MDNLVNDVNNTKKVTVGLPEEEDAAILTRKINGMMVEGKILYVEALKKKQVCESFKAYMYLSSGLLFYKLKTILTELMMRQNIFNFV